MSHKLFSVVVDSIKGCKQAQIVIADRPMTVIGGDNAQGKSSFLDAIAMALGGKKMFPKQPIYNDQEEATVTLHVTGESSYLPGPCTITRWLQKTEDGEITTRVKIESEDGSLAPSPQAILNDILGAGLTFDPVSFTREKPSRQVDIVRNMVGLDFSLLDVEYEKVYTERTHVNRLHKQLDGKIKQTPLHPKVPAEKISVRALMDQLREINGHNQEVQSQQRQIEVQQKQIELDKQQIAEKLRRIEELKQEIEGLSSSIADHETTIEAIQADPITPRDPEPVQQQIEEAEEINRKIDENSQRLDLLTELKGYKAKSKQLSKRLQEIEQDKAEQTAAANWPIKGMGFGKDGLELNGKPFQDLSSREQLNCSVAIALKLNPVFPFIVIKNGSLLDQHGLAELEQILKNHDGQALVERVSKDERCNFVFEQGVIK
jgi:DNA repair ATPase RecN